MIKMSEYQSKGEENGVVEKRLCDHQRQSEDASLLVPTQHGAEDQADSEDPPGMNLHFVCTFGRLRPVDRMTSTSTR
jgi:hypothetical protein